MIKNSNIWMSKLLDVAKDKGTRVDYRFSFWESYYDEGFTPTKALEEELKKRKVKATQNKLNLFG